MQQSSLKQVCSTTCLARAKALIEEAIKVLDDAGASGHLAARLDHVLHSIGDGEVHGC